MIRKITIMGVALSMSTGLSGCAETVLSGVTSVGYSVAQERSVGQAIDDLTIVSNVKKLYLEAQVDDLLVPVNVEVHEGRVLLTGKVKSPDVSVEAVRLAWQPPGVKEVINELKVDDGGLDAKKYAVDVRITTEVKAKLFLNKIVRSINYSVETVDGTVYLMGIARTQDELEEAVYVSQHVSGVKKVVSHVLLKDDPNRG